MRLRSLSVSALLVGGLGLVPVAALTSQPAAASSSVDFAGFDGAYREVGYEDRGFVGTGLPGGFLFFDGDLPPSLAGIGVRLTSSADPVGIVVLARRTARNAADYRGSFRFSTVASDQSQAVLRVTDGATITFSHFDPSNAYGQPELVERSTTWRRGSAVPHFAELVYSTADPARPVVHGAWRAVAPGATVRAYATADSSEALGSTVADSTGAFGLEVAAERPVRGDVWVAAAEPGEVESERRQVVRAAVTGSIVLPEGERQGVWGTGAWVRPVGTVNPCGTTPNCSPHGAVSDRSGRFIEPWDDPMFQGVGAYEVDVGLPGQVNDAAPSPWDTAAYGVPPTVTVERTDADVTVEAGEIALLPPNFHARVVDSSNYGLDDAGVFVLAPDGADLPGGGNARSDGRLALFLPDGDYRLRIVPPAGCRGYVQVDTDLIRVRDGLATPATAIYDLGPGDPIIGEDISVPVDADGPLQLEVGFGGNVVGLKLDGASGSGTVLSRCGAGPDAGFLTVGTPVEVTTRNLSFSSASVCLTYTPSDLARAGVDAAAVELIQVGESSRHVITESHDAATGTVCGTTSTLSGFALASESDVLYRFNDIEGNLHRETIESLARRGVVRGCDEVAGRYCPSGRVTRGQMATFLARALELPPSSVDQFDDDDGTLHEDSVNRVAEAGVVRGFADGTFRPSVPLNRGQMATFLAAGFQTPPSEHNPFIDAEGVHAASIRSIAAAGITAGCTRDGFQYCPNQPVRRDQMASFIGRALALGG